MTRGNERRVRSSTRKIFTVGAYKATLRFGCGSFQDVSAETGGLCDSGWVWDDLVTELTHSDIKQMRKDFLKYIPDGDDYGVYVLTDKGREDLEAQET